MYQINFSHDNHEVFVGKLKELCDMSAQDLQKELQQQTKNEYETKIREAIDDGTLDKEIAIRYSNAKEGDEFAVLDFNVMSLDVMKELYNKRYMIPIVYGDITRDISIRYTNDHHHILKEFGLDIEKYFVAGDQHIYENTFPTVCYNSNNNNKNNSDVFLRLVREFPQETFNKTWRMHMDQYNIFKESFEISPRICVHLCEKDEVIFGLKNDDLKKKSLIKMYGTKKKLTNPKLHSEWFRNLVLCIAKSQRFWKFIPETTLSCIGDAGKNGGCFIIPCAFELGGCEEDSITLIEHICQKIMGDSTSRFQSGPEYVWFEQIIGKPLSEISKTSFIKRKKRINIIKRSKDNDEEQEIMTPKRQQKLKLLAEQTKQNTDEAIRACQEALKSKGNFAEYYVDHDIRREYSLFPVDPIDVMIDELKKK